MHRDALPDFRNLGVTLRIVFIVVFLCAFAALVRAPRQATLFDAFLEVLAPVQPVLVLSLLGLWALDGGAAALKYPAGIAAYS
jgi:two-component system sensor histidine kinase AlgZ